MPSRSGPAHDVSGTCELARWRRALDCAVSLVRVWLTSEFVHGVVTLLPMDSTRSRLEHQAPHWVRVCVHSFLIVAFFAMHNVLADSGDQFAGHHASPDPTTQLDAAIGLSSLIADHHRQSAGLGDGQEPLGSISDCCGLLMLCLTMIVGGGALLFIRRKLSERVLWQLPPPSRVRALLRVSPFQGLTPFQRSSILRC